MKQSQSHSIHLFGALTALLFLPILFMFQNCSEPLGDQEPNNSEKEENPIIFSSDKPFPFEIKANYLAYMSCSGMSATNSPAYFTFRTGAFKDNQIDDVGLKLAGDFLNRTRLFETGNRISYLRDSLPLEGLALQFGINKRADYSPARSNIHNLNILPELESDAILKRLSRDLFKSVHFFENIKGTSKRHIRSSIALNNLSEVDHQQLRNQVSRQAGADNSLLTLSFTVGIGAQGFLLGHKGLVSDKNPDSKPYGKGYELSFTQGENLPISNLPLKVNPLTNVLAGVTEFDLNSDVAVPATSWSCNNDLKLMVVQYHDALTNRGDGTHVCPRRNTGLDLTSTEHQALSSLIKLEHWYVNIAQKCITPRKPPSGSTCYGPQTRIFTVDYTGINAGDACNGNIRDAEKKPVICPQFFSICRKTGD